MMKPLKIAFLLFAVSALSACSWQRVDDPPAYKAEKLPIVIGLSPAENPISKGLAPDLAKELETIGEFERIVYPYRPGDPVDCLFGFDATASVEGSGVGAGVASGLTLGLAGTVVGPSTNLIHDVDFLLTNGQAQVAHEKVHAESEAEFGVFADTTEVAMKQTALQLRRLAMAIAEKLKMHRQAIVEVCTGYSV